jgi:ferredoxin
VKIIVDAAACEAHGDCVVAAPDVFDLGEDDEVVRVIDQTLSEDVRSKVEMAVRVCPVAAIRIEG